jgi:RNA polymerase sigma-70 factor (ECF subfamily)
LCERYWFPLFAYVRRLGHPAQDAEDLVQGFFAHFIGAGILARADVERGRFRSFVLGCLNHFLAHEWQRGQRLKRGGGALVFSLDEEQAEARFALELADEEETEARLARELVDEAAPDRAYDRAWAHTLLDRVTAQLRSECEEGEKAGRFEVLQSFLAGERGEVSFAEAAASLGLTVAATKSVVHRLRTRYRELIRAEVRETVASDEEVDDELRHLFAALGG